MWTAPWLQGCFGGLIVLLKKSVPQGNVFGTGRQLSFASDFCNEKTLADQRAALVANVLNFATRAELL
jgi:hypothetical protein